MSSSHGHRRTLDQSREPIPSTSDWTGSVGTYVNPQRPRTLNPVVSNTAWTASSPPAMWEFAHSPEYTTSQHRPQLPSVHTLLGSLSPQATHDRPHYSVRSDSIRTSIALSSVTSMPSPVSLGSADVVDIRNHSVDLPRQGPLDGLNWQACYPTEPPSMHVTNQVADRQPLLPNLNSTSGQRKTSKSTTSRQDKSSNAGGEVKVRRTYASRKVVPRTWSYTRCLPGGDLIYVYDDGSECPAVRDGEAVNKHWATTKAGKARKRKPQACLTCREKKIRCVQLEGATNSRCRACTRFDKPCLWGHSAAVSSPATPGGRETRSPSRGSSRKASASSYDAIANVSNDNTGQGKYQTSSNHSRGNSVSNNNTPSTKRLPTERRRRSAHAAEMSASTLPVRNGRPQHETTSHSLEPSEQSIGASFSLDDDPYKVSSVLTKRLIDLYFFYRESDLDAVLPRAQFQQWLETCQQKTMSDIMLLYSMLALATIYDSSTEVKRIGQQLADIARHAERESFSRPTLQLAQTRLNLCLYYFAEGLKEAAWEYAVTAHRVLLALDFNTERGVRDVATDVSVHEYGMSSVQLVECRRRTFWSGYLLSRLSGLCDISNQSIHDTNIFVHLPSFNTDFQAGIPHRESPQFNPSATDAMPLSGLSDMALLVNIAGIHGDVVSFAQRSKHHPSPHYSAHYETFYTDIQKRLQAWDASIPVQLRYCPENTSASTKDGSFASYLSLHIARCACGMQLHLAGRPDKLSVDMLRYNIQQAFQYALTLLSLLLTFVQGGSTANSSAEIQRALAQPFLAPAITLACDIISSGGPQDIMGHTRARLRAAAFVVSQSAHYWNASEALQRSIEDRLVQFDSIASNGDQHWVISSSMDPASDNMLYAAPVDFRLEAISGVPGWGTTYMKSETRACY